MHCLCLVFNANIQCYLPLFKNWASIYLFILLEFIFPQNKTMCVCKWKESETDSAWMDTKRKRAFFYYYCKVDIASCVPWTINLTFQGFNVNPCNMWTLITSSVVWRQWYGFSVKVQILVSGYLGPSLIVTLLPARWFGVSFLSSLCFNVLI